MTKADIIAARMNYGMGIAFMTAAINAKIEHQTAISVVLFIGGAFELWMGSHGWESKGFNGGDA